MAIAVQGNGFKPPMCLECELKRAGIKWKRSVNTNRAVLRSYVR